MRVSKNIVIQAASDLADKDGLNNVSLKAVAAKLNIRTPSLYNHIKSLDDLLREVAHTGMRTMNDNMSHSALGKIGDNAIKEACSSYLQFTIEHPGVYETIQWAAWHGNEDTAKILTNYKSLLTTLILSCGFDECYSDEIVNLIMGVLHGYITLQLGHALKNPREVKENLCNAVDTVLIGLYQKYK